jgi:hypothetical protein
MARLPEEHAGVADAALAGTTAVVTGSTSGIGRQIALSLGRLGAHVVVHGRDRDAGTDVVAELDETAGSGEFVAADFATQDGVREFAATVQEQVDEIDLLHNNAGTMFRSGRLTDDGIEATLAVNHLAPFLLTHLLFPSLAADGRVVTTSSGAHRQARIDFESLRTVDGYSGTTAYARSKLANVLFTRELARRTDRVTANCFDPGFVPGSDFFRAMPAVMRIQMTAASVIPGIGRSIEQGAATGVYLGVSDAVADTSGKYFSRCSERRPSRAARDDKTARRLWEVSEDLTGIESSELLTPAPESG